MILYVYFHNYYLTFYILKHLLRCQLNRFLHKTEDNTRHPIKYCTGIRQDNDTVCAENYCMKIIMCIISHFICTNLGNLFYILASML